MEPSTTGNYFTIIPNEVMYDKTLSQRAIVLYGFISNLANSKGYCYASNKYLADLISTAPSTMQRALKELIDPGYVLSVLFYKPNGEIDYRALTPSITQFRSKAEVKEKTITTVDEDMDFIEFWTSYPRKINKKSAKDEFRMIKNKEVVLSAVKLYKIATDKWSQADKQYIPSPHNWLAAENYNDDPSAWVRLKAVSKTPEVYTETKERNYSI